MPSRRTYLAGAGALVASAAGCVSTGSEDDSGGGDPSTPTPDDPAGVTVEDLIVRKAVTYESKMGSGGVLAAEGKQYVVASVSSSREVSRSDFAFDADGEEWSPGLPDTHGATNRSVAGRGSGPLGRAHAPDGAYLAFVVPSPLSASGAAVRYTGAEPGTWPLDGAARERLGAPGPQFELRDLQVPSKVRQGEPLDLTLSVENVSETDGRFLAAVYWPTEGIADDDESHVVEREVAAGERATVSRSIDTRYTAMEDGPVSLRVRGHVGASREVQVRDSSTPE